MNEFQPHFIEEAIRHLFDANQQVKNRANDVLKRWKVSEQAEYTAFFILQRSIDIHARQVAAFSLIEMTEKNWPRFEESFRNQVKTYCISQLDVPTIPENLRRAICSILVAVAAFEWPEIWPNFMDSLIAMEDEGDMKNRVLLLGMFAEYLQKCEVVPYNRLMQIRVMYASYTKPLIDLASFVIMNNELESSLSSSVLLILNSLLMYSTKQIFNEELLNYILQMTLTDRARDLAFQCLSTVFLNRYDFGEVFKLFGSKLFQFFASLQSLGDSSFTFLVSFLLKYSVVVECINMNQLAPKLVELVLKDSYAEVFPTINNPALLECLQAIYSLIFSSIVPTSSKKLYWKLLESILTRFVNNISVNIFAPLIINIQRSFLNNLPNAIENGRILFSNVPVVASYLFKIDPTFLSSQYDTNSPSIYLGIAYSLGFSDANQMNLKLVQELLAVSNQYLSAVLFSLSRLNIFLPELLNLALQGLEMNDNNIQISASRALYILFKNNPQFLQNELPKLIKRFTEINLISTIDSDASVRLLKLCCLGGAFQQVAQFLIYLLNTDTIFALISFRELFYLRGKTNFSIDYNSFFQMFCSYLTQTEDNDIMVASFSALASLFANSPYSDIAIYINEFIKIIINMPQITNLFFGAITTCRKTHPEFDIFAETIQKFIQDNLSVDGIICSSLFTMISVFLPDKFDVDFLSVILSNGIANIESTKEALKCSKIILTKRSNITEKLWKVIGFSTMKSFIDGQHCHAFDLQTKILYILISKIDHKSIKIIIQNAIKECLSEANDESILNFADQMIKNANDIFSFRQFSANTLVEMNRIAETDLTNFNNKMIQKTILKLEIGDSAASDIINYHKNFDYDLPVFKIQSYRFQKRR